MRALIKDKAGPGLVLGETPRPEPGEDEILVRIRRTSICGTDLHIWNWGRLGGPHRPRPARHRP